MRARFVAERGSYDTVYSPKRDWEILDLSRGAGSRVIARCNATDARWIASVLNAAVGANVVDRPWIAMAETAMQQIEEGLRQVEEGLKEVNEARAELGLPPCSD